MRPKKYNALDLFAGAGGLTEGLHQAGFKTVAAIEIVPAAVKTFRLNHPKAKVFQQDIRNVDTDAIRKILKGQPLHLLAGCPPCQGFSSIRRLNRKESVEDNRNDLVLEYLRLVEELRPFTIMMENVPALEGYNLFKDVVTRLQEIGYKPKVKVVNVKDYGIAQRRRRLVLVGSLLGQINVAPSTKEKVTVRDVIGSLEPSSLSNDPIHRIHAVHSAKIQDKISRIPINGGSLSDLPEEDQLKCHSHDNIGFYDVYGRLRWDDYSTTITGGCLNPSKGRFLHPEYDRSLTAREAALLQSFPKEYHFPESLTKAEIALQIGNALPPKFSFYQSRNIYNHLKERSLAGII